jgi:hypothetical protein
MDIDYSYISLNFDENSNLADFKKRFSKNIIFKRASEKNKDFFSDLFQFLSTDKNRPKRTFTAFNKSLNVYHINGFGDFFHSNYKQSHTLFDYAKKVNYLSKLERNIADLQWHNIDQLNEAQDAVYNKWSPHFNKNFFKHFNEHGISQVQSNSYTNILSYAVINILSSIRIYYKELSEYDILNLQDNAINFAKIRVSESMDSFHKLIAYIDLNTTPNKKYNALKFLDYYINQLNETFFSKTFLFEILQSERKKLFNKEVIDKIKFEAKLQELDLLLTGSESVSDNNLANTENSNQNEFEKNLFINLESQQYFEKLLEHLGILRKTISTSGNQAKLKGIWDNPKSKKVFFKPEIKLSVYVDYLNNKFGTKYNARSMSDGYKYKTTIDNFLSEHGLS